MRAVPIALAALAVLASGPALGGGAVTNVHDPHIIKQGSYYYIFSTGAGIPVRRSSNLVDWTYIGNVFPTAVPAWAKTLIPGADSVWAADPVYVNGRYLLYYCVSTFGSNRSVIGVAENKTLHPGTTGYQWNDLGLVIQSYSTDNWNALDPNAMTWQYNGFGLTYGSYWTGIKFLWLDPATGKPYPTTPVLDLAARPGNTAIEAGYMFKRGGWFYLFTSFDQCCNGVNSTYNIRVTRAINHTRPFVDRDGVPALQGGGTLLMGTDGRRIGPGHQSVLRDGDRTYLVYHYYDGQNNGTPTLGISPLYFDADQWPYVGPPIL
jgi:arabinan endo-1,5-alpha-L-arabinosidase